MSMTRHLMAAATVVTLLAVPAIGGAQTNQQAAPPAITAGDGAVAFGADDGEWVPEGFALRGRAEVVQGGNRLRADAIRGFTNAENDLQRVEASGNVYFVTPTQTIRGDRAVYTLSSNEVVVTGDVILTQGQNVLTGGRLVYNTRTETARLDGAGNGRIRGVFYPDSNGN